MKTKLKLRKEVISVLSPSVALRGGGLDKNDPLKSKADVCHGFSFQSECPCDTFVCQTPETVECLNPPTGPCGGPEITCACISFNCESAAPTCVHCNTETGLL